MRPDGLESIESVRAFLRSVVLPEVRDDVATELRAAIKLLHTAGRELAVADLVLARETSELLAACEAAVLIGSRREDDAPPRAPGEPIDLPARAELHRDTRLRTARVLAALQGDARRAPGEVARSRARAQLRDLYALLARHATQRGPWQSVFQGPQQEETS